MAKANTAVVCSVTIVSKDPGDCFIVYTIQWMGNLELQGLVDHLVGFLGFVATAMVVNRIKLAYRDAARIEKKGLLASLCFLQA
jgi:hypothetical protein